MRVFIAIEFDDSIKKYLSEKQQEVMQSCIKGNFTHPGNFHLTLRFIGEVAPPALTKLKKAVDATSAGLQSFELILDELGQFPRGSRKILWIGLKPSRELQRLYKALEVSLEEQGYPEEGRGYNPHITLGREVLVEDDPTVQHIHIRPEKIHVKGISLMESTRVEGKLVYRPIHRVLFPDGI